MIVLDNETTKLTDLEAAPLAQQPFVVEFAAIKLCDRTLKELGRMEFLCSLPPGTAFPEEAQKITGITPATIAGLPPFAAHYRELVDFFLGERRMSAHNLPYDVSVLKYELMRLGKLTAFPWPPEQICTVEASIGIKGHRLNLGALHELATGAPHKDAHRAMTDVEALVTCIRWLAGKGLIGWPGLEAVSAPALPKGRRKR